jgi:hypothetical protein
MLELELQEILGTGLARLGQVMAKELEPTPQGPLS